IAGALCPSDTADHGKSRRCRLGHVISCVQSQLITWDMYTDHQGTDDQCALMISVAPEVPRVSAHQCHVSCPSVPSMPHISAYQCTIMPHISAYLSCLLMSPISASQCHLSMPISATYQCQSVSPISAHQCQSVLPISAIYQCHVSVLPFSAHQ
ncbi:unnamed protein product, partial [Staurois parvus]